MGSNLFTTSGNTTWTASNNIASNSVTIECWGAGGAGGGNNGTRSGGGGGGGAYGSNTLTVSNGTVYNLLVGAGGVRSANASGGAGGNSDFNNGTAVIARGQGGGGGSHSFSTQGQRGLASSSIGTTTRDGGNGSANNGAQGGGGGGGAGNAANGTNATSPATAGGAGGGTGTGAGGIGGNGGVAANGNVGTAPGGAGGGSANASGAANVGGNGANGQVRITWTDVVVPTVTTQATTTARETTATGNGNITNTGGWNCSERGVVYDTATKSLPGNVAPASSGYASVQNETGGSFGTGAYTESITGLSGNTTYFARAYAKNTAGYAYGSEVSWKATVVVPGVLSQTTTTFAPKNAFAVIPAKLSLVLTTFAPTVLSEKVVLVESNTVALSTTDAVYNNNFGGQSFTGDGSRLRRVLFELALTGGALSGTVVCKLYAHSGTYGSSGIPTGTALATSTAINCSGIKLARNWFTFTFDATYMLVSGTKYFVVLETLAGDGSNAIGVSAKSPSQISGNAAFFNGSSWFAEGTTDWLLYVYGIIPPIPDTATLTITTFAPKSVVGTHIIPGAQSLSITTFAPTIAVTTGGPSITFLEPGGAATGGTELWDEVVGGAGWTVDTTVKPSGAYSSLRREQTGGGGGQLGAFALGNTNRISFYFRTTAIPMESGILYFLSLASGFTGLFVLETNGKLRYYEGDFTTAHDGTATLLPNTWYRLSFAFDQHSVTNDLAVKIYVDGQLDISATGCGTGGNSIGKFQISADATSPGDFNYFSHIYVDDGSDLTDPGDIRVTAKFPGTVNANNFDTTGGTGAVNERPLSETNYVRQAGSSQVAQNYNLQALAAGDKNLEGCGIVGYMGWLWAKEAAVSGTPKITVNGSDYDITLTTSPAIYREPVTDPAYPTDAAAIGMKSSGTADDTYLYECGVVIAYQVPNIIHLDPGGDATESKTFITASNNSAGQSYDTSVKYRGVGSYQFDAGASNVITNAFGPSAANILAGANRISFRFRYDSVPSQNVPIIRIYDTNGNQGRIFGLYLIPSGAGVLVSYYDENSVLTDGTTVLLANTWYRISFGFDLVGANSNSCKIYADGNEEVSVTGQFTNARTTATGYSFGWNEAPGANKKCWFDQIYIDDGTDLSDPGDIEVTAKLPGTVNANNFDTTGGTGAVNERPLSETNYKLQAASSQVRQNYAIEARDSGDADLSSAEIIGYMGWLWAKEAAVSGTPKITVNGLDYALALTTSPALYRQCAQDGDYPVMPETIGMVSSGTADDTTLYEAGMVVAFIPAAANVTTVTPDALALVATEFAPKLALHTIPANISLTLTTFAPKSVVGTHVVPNTLALTTTKFAPKLALSVIPATKALATTSFAPKLAANIIIPATALVTTKFAPKNAFAVIPTTKSLTTTKFAPTIVTPVTCIPNALALTTTKFASVLALHVIPNKLSLTTTAFAPVEVFKIITASPTALIITKFAPRTGYGYVPAKISFTTSAFAPKISYGIVPATKALSLAEFSPVLALHVIPSVTSLVTTKFAPTLTANVTVTPNTVALVTTKFAPFIVANVTVILSTQSLVLAKFAPALALHTIPSTVNLTTTKFAPRTVLGTQVVPATIALSTTTYRPVLALHIIPNKVALVTSTFAPSLTANVTVTPGVTILVTTKFAPTVTGHYSVIPNTTALATQKFAVRLALSTIPATINLTTTKFAPIISAHIIPNTKALILTKFAPSAGAPIALIPSTNSLTMSEFAPQLRFAIRAVPSTLALSLTKFAPSSSVHITVTPPIKVLTTVEFAPRLNYGIVPSTLSLTTTRYQPRLSLNILLGLKQLFTVKFAPVALIQSATGGPVSATLTLTEYSPLLNIGITLSPLPLHLTITQHTPIKLPLRLSELTGIRIEDASGMAGVGFGKSAIGISFQRRMSGVTFRRLQ